MGMWGICVNNKDMIFCGKIRACIREHVTSNSFGIVDYCDKFVDECTFSKCMKMNLVKAEQLINWKY